MTISKFFIQLVIALVCAGIANVLLPRQIPGKTFGFLVIGLAGVFFGEWVVDLIKRTYPIQLAILDWEIQGVPIIPSILGSTIILYVLTTFLGWGRYGNRR
jgi:uncharacterized membrane protein YeaQ/YmgE (transglycosylase-associated protein family)